MQLIGFGPPDFPAYVRLRYIPDPTKPDQSESDVNFPDDHPSDFEQARRAHGHHPHRRYFLLHGSLTDLDSWDETLGGAGSPPRPDFAWPADHSWCLASDVDPHWAGIGAGHAAIDSLLNDPELDVVPAQPTETQPTYYY